MISLTKDKELKGYKSLTVYPEVAHFVTTRHGGVSEGTYGSFNCSPYTKDSCINVNCNQNKLFQITGHQIKELVIPEQKHGSASLVVDESFFKESLEVRRTLLRGRDIVFVLRLRIVYPCYYMTEGCKWWLPFTPVGKARCSILSVV